jgi:hypothetical protein
MSVREKTTNCAHAASGITFRKRPTEMITLISKTLRVRVKSKSCISAITMNTLCYYGITESATKGALQFDWSSPLKGACVANAQVFDGYGESLIDRSPCDLCRFRYLTHSWYSSLIYKITSYTSGRYEECQSSYWHRCLALCKIVF